MKAPISPPQASPRRSRAPLAGTSPPGLGRIRSEEHTSELQSRFDLVCRLLLEKKKNYLEATTRRVPRRTGGRVRQERLDWQAARRHAKKRDATYGQRERRGAQVKRAAQVPHSA